MALSFQRQGIFGRRNPLPDYRSPWETPGFGDGINQQQSGMDAAPPPNAMPIGVEQITKKPGFFGQGGAGRAIAGTIGDFLLQQSGMDPVYLPNILQQRDAEERARMAQQQRMQAREDKQWEWQNKPKEAPNNDTINDFNWYKSLPEEERKLYHQMKPVVGYMADGTPRVINPYEAQKPAMQAGAIEDGYRFKGGDPADPNAWEKVGGQSGAPTGGFR